MKDDSTKIIVHGQEDAPLLTIYDPEDPDSLVNKVPRHLRDKILAIHPRFYRASEIQLEQWCRPGEIDRKMRILFWEEFNKSTAENREMSMPNVYGPVCTKNYFFDSIISRPQKLAYMVTPGYEYSLDIKELHMLGIERMRRTLLANPFSTDAKGVERVNVKLIAEQVKIFALVDNRAKGAVLQRLQVDQRSLNVNVNQNIEKSKSVAEIEAEIAQLETDIRHQQRPQLTESHQKLLIQEEALDAEKVVVGSEEQEEF